jgi:hypothetical protein
MAMVHLSGSARKSTGKSACATQRERITHTTPLFLQESAFD